MTANAFEQYADKAIGQAAIRAAEKRATSKAARQALAQQQRWNQCRHDRQVALLAGPYAGAPKALVGCLAEITLPDGKRLVTTIEQGPWRQADRDTRFEILGLVDIAIVRLREQHRLPPFDDALPGQPPSIFQIIREYLR